MFKSKSVSSREYLLVCPQCKTEELSFSTNLIQCKFCAAKFVQVDDEYLNLMPKQFLEGCDAVRWQERLIEMESWYKDLSLNPKSACSCFLSDYEPYASLLAEISGDVLDIGGGIGFPRQYLPSNSNYTVIDPSLEWFKGHWFSLIDNFSCLQQKPKFIRGVGEYLPFSSERFDAVLSFWSLNHACNPEQVFAEAGRVLRSGGTFLLVLEDMMPQWPDLLNPVFPAKKVFYASFHSLQPKLLQRLLSRFYMVVKRIRHEEWPLQNDHILILESDVKDWAEHNFNIEYRKWMGPYLVFQLRKK